MRLPTIVLATLAGSMMLPASAVTLYDPAAGLPGAQGWTPGFFPVPGSDSLVGDHLRIDTSGTSQHGHFRTAPVALDTVAGFTLNFGLQVIAETHGAATNRAGFSLLVQGQDQAQALELSFWGDQVWALQYQPGGADGGFVRGDFATLDTQSSFRAYALTVKNDQFTLRVDGIAVLSGPMRDYPTLASNPATQVYASSNLVFFGDDTSQASSKVDLGSITLAPEPAPSALLAAGLVVLAWRTGRRPS
jgi:hypothetical protein